MIHFIDPATCNVMPVTNDWMHTKYDIYIHNVTMDTLKVWGMNAKY